MNNVFERAMNYLLSIGIADIFDIIIIAVIIYEIIMLVRKTNSVNVARGILALVAVLWLSEVLNLTMVNYFLRKALELGLLALVILFQPEIRGALEKIGGSLARGVKTNPGLLSDAISQSVIATTDMSKSKTGALIVFERDIKLTEAISTGTIINSDVSAELLKNIFYDKAPLHDGAVIIRDGKIAAAGCMLPLTKNTNLSKDLGMRHRAGIGESEHSDAVVVIVSEETGAVSVALQGMLKRHLRPATLDKLLRTELIVEEEGKKKLGLASLVQSIVGEEKNEDAEDVNEKDISV